MNNIFAVYFIDLMLEPFRNIFKQEEGN